MRWRPGQERACSGAVAVGCSRKPTPGRHAAYPRGGREPSTRQPHAPERGLPREPGAGPTGSLTSASPPRRLDASDLPFAGRSLHSLTRVYPRRRHGHQRASPDPSSPDASTSGKRRKPLLRPRVRKGAARACGGPRCRAAKTPVTSGWEGAACFSVDRTCNSALHRGGSRRADRVLFRAREDDGRSETSLRRAASPKVVRPGLAQTTGVRAFLCCAAAGSSRTEDT